jgi:hypothetical protein
VLSHPGTTGGFNGEERQDQPHMRGIPLHVNQASDPARRRAIVCGLASLPNAPGDGLEAGVGGQSPEAGPPGAGSALAPQGARSGRSHHSPS